MGAKKIIIPIAIAAVVACGVGYYCYTTVNATSQESNTTVSSSSETANSTTSTAVESTGVNASASKTVSTVNNTGTEGEVSKVNSTSNSNATSSTVKNSGGSTSTKASSDTTTTGTTTSNNTTSEKTNSGTITYTVPNGQYSSSAILVKNTTGNPISESQLNEYLRSWIMSSQDCISICDATGTYWEEPWLNKVPQETMYQAFIDANGEAALSQNITANEFIKATQELDRLTINDVPFTLSQAKALILNMLQEDGYATPSEVTKIVFVQGKEGYGNVYEVYTKQSGNYIYWTVDANTGYAHG